MAIRFYDEAIVNKIQGWITDPNMVVLKPNEVSRLWQTRADQENDEPLTLPLIAISREPSVSLKVSTKRPLTFDGKQLDGTPMNTIQLNAVPMMLSYQIDIYTQSYAEGDEYLRNFIFNIINHNECSVVLPYNDTDVEHVFHIELDPNVTDNSDVAEKLFPDQFTRWSLKINVTDAYMWSIPVQRNARIVGAVLDLQDPEIPNDDYEGLNLNN